MRRSQLIAAVVFGVLAGAVFTHAAAQSPAAPGAGHGFLIDKHVAAGLNCAACHKESTATAPDTATCLSCHGGTYAKLAQMTGQDQPNPHASHQGDIPCAQCHHVHQASVTLCNQCHTFDMRTP